MFASMGQSMPGSSSMPDPAGLLIAQCAKLEQWMKDTVTITNQVNPALSALLAPIAQAGKALAMESADIQQRNGAASPQLSGTMPPNVPGNIPGGRPAA